MRIASTVAGLAALILVLDARGTGPPPPPPRPATVAMEADVTVLGKVTEIEKDPVEVKSHYAQSADPTIPYMVAVIKIDTPLVGAKGLTQLRVGFLEKYPRTRTPVVPPASAPTAPPKLAVGQEGCFFLDRHPSADFYLLRAPYAGVLKTDKDFDAVMAEVRIVAKVIADPAEALRAKAAEDRYLAAAAILATGPRIGPDGVRDVKTEDLPADVNKLVLGVLREMPWNRTTYTQGRLLAPNLTREQLWHFVPAAAMGYKLPHAPPTPRGVSPPDMSKERDESTAAFLKENMERIQLKRMVRGR